ncbi:MAG: CPBP family intramembrane metalloprotease [Planctomycetaceae bacterium]|jgi:membrane protease YdiL (CAAX protease family)|nr:CPBP family intramembrane metalloprotease [Planctomycetaceae bacterium]
MFFPQNQFKPVLILFYVIVASSVWKYFSIPIAAGSFDNNWATLFWLGMYPLVGSFLLFGVIPMMIIRYVFHEHLTDYGLRFGIPLRTIRSFLMAAPLVTLIAVLTGHNAAFFDVYPLNEAIRPQNARIGYSFFAMHAVIYLGYYFGWEFMFRGFLQHGLSTQCGIPTAILIQTLASTMLHYGHPVSEVFGAMIAGLVWGVLAFRTRSIFSGFAQHALLGIVLDWTLIFTRQINGDF